MTEQTKPTPGTTPTREFRYWCATCHVMFRGDAARRHFTFMRAKARQADTERVSTPIQRIA